MLRDALFENPGVVFVGCLTWIPAIIWIVSMMHWMIMRDIEFIPGVIGICFALGLGIASMAPSLRQFNGLFFVAMVATVAVYPFLRNALEKRENTALELEQFERAYQAVSLRPDNIGARFKVAQTAYDRGFIGSAVSLVEPYMAQLDKRMFWEEHAQYRRWVTAGVPPETLKPLRCLDCGSDTAVNLLHCPKCGSPVLLERIKGKSLDKSLGKKLFAAWAAMVVVLAGLPIASSLPPIAGIALVVFLLAVLCLTFYLAFGKPQGAST